VIGAPDPRQYCIAPKLSADRGGARATGICGGALGAISQREASSLYLIALVWLRVGGTCRRLAVRVTGCAYGEINDFEEQLIDAAGW
jgi:hypothetical protein